MKRCPECRRDYYDDSLLYCLDDGSALLEGPGKPFTKSVEMRGQVSADAPTLPAADLYRHTGTTVILPRVPDVQSIAVLPFANISDDPGNDYLCDGLAEELLNALSKIDDLKVAARTSAFSFKGAATSISSIGRLLGVQRILEGSVRRSADRVRVTVKLVNADDGYQIWSESYDRKMEDIFAIEDEITLAVVESLKMKVFGEKRSALVRRYTDNAEAYQLYLMGRFQFNKFTVDGCRRAIEYFERTLAVEPNYAPAYAGIAEACGMQWYISTYADPALVAREREAVERALELEPALAEAYRSRGLLRCYVDWDFEGADRDYRKALELNPNDPLAHAWYALLLAALGQRQEAVAAAQNARTLDPLSGSVALMSGWAMWFSLDYEACLDTSLAALEIEPDSHEALRLKGAALWALGDLERASTELEKAVELGSRPLAISALCCLRTQMDDADGALDVMRQLEEQYANGMAPAVSLAYALLALGETGKGYQYLEEALENREGEMIFLRAWPRWINPVHSEPRFLEIVERIGLPSRSR